MCQTQLLENVCTICKWRLFSRLPFYDTFLGRCQHTNAGKVNESSRILKHLQLMQMSLQSYVWSCEFRAHQSESVMRGSSNKYALHMTETLNFQKWRCLLILIKWNKRQNAQSSMINSEKKLWKVNYVTSSFLPMQ